MVFDSLGDVLVAVVGGNAIDNFADDVHLARGRGHVEMRVGVLNLSEKVFTFRNVLATHGHNDRILSDLWRGGPRYDAIVIEAITDGEPASDHPMR